MRRLKIPVFKLVLLAVFPLSAASNSVAVNVTFESGDFPGKMELYEARESSKYDISETKVVKKTSELPVRGKLMTKVHVTPGEGKSFVLVMKNPTKKTIYFFASPHTAMPHEHALGFHFECLCIHHVFKVPPGQIWYRIVRLELDPKSPVHPKEIKHSIVPVSEADAKGAYKDRMYQETAL